jgi:DNA-binding NtrC family response regulator
MRDSQIILVVEDEISIQKLLKATLQSQTKNYDLLIADSGEEGLRFYREFRARIAVALIDYSLPGMKGSTLIRRLKEITPNVKCILMTGHRTVDDIDEATIPVLNKPFTIQNLMKVLGEAIPIESKQENK